MTTIQELYNHLKTLNKQWFYDKDEIDNLLEAKLDEVDVPSKVSDLDNDTGFITAEDITGKANSSDLASVATSGSYNDLINKPETFTPSSHNHTATEVTDSSAYANLGTSQGATQHSINTAVDTKIGALLSLDLIMIEDELPGAGENTRNKFYLIPEEDQKLEDGYEIFVTVKTPNEVEQDEPQTYSYSWEKVDSARLDLSDYAHIDHTHGNLTTDGCIGNVADKVVVTTTNGLVTTSDWVTEVDNVIQALNTYGNSLNNNNSVSSRIISFTCDSNNSIMYLVITPLDTFRESGFPQNATTIPEFSFVHRSTNDGIAVYGNGYYNDSRVIEDGDYVIMALTDNNNDIWNIETINGDTPTTATYTYTQYGIDVTCPVFTVDANHTEFALVMNGTSTMPGA